MKKSLNFIVNIKLLQKLRNITDISLCKEVLHSLYGPSFKILELMVLPIKPRQTDGGHYTIIIPVKDERIKIG